MSTFSPILASKHLVQYLANWGFPNMPKNKNDILQGTLALLVLKTLSSQRRMHGYAMTNHIQRVSNELLRVEEGSLYPALHRLEDEGWVRAEWGTTETGREARFYSITSKGRTELAREEENWARLTEGVRRILRYA
jgi:transcriptional regulator